MYAKNLQGMSVCLALGRLPEFLLLFTHVSHSRGFSVGDTLQQLDTCRRVAIVAVYYTQKPKQDKEDWVRK